MVISQGFQCCNDKNLAQLLTLGNRSWSLLSSWDLLYFLYILRTCIFENNNNNNNNDNDNNNDDNNNNDNNNDNTKST